MINKTKYAVLILSANIFLCSAEKECEFLKLFTTRKQENIENNDISIELPEILKKENDKITNIETANVETTKKNETKLDKDKKKEGDITLKDLLDYGLEQKANEAKEESVEKIREQNLKTIETLIKGFELSRLPNILKKIVNRKSLIDAYKEDKTFQKLSCVEQIKLILMFWCLQSQIEFNFQNETIEQFTKKITYSNIKKILNDKIDELINKEKNTKKETSEGNKPEEDSKNWESYKNFKISDNENIKPLFYYFIKECILTSIAILIHKYCSLCKDKFGEVFIGENKGEFTDYTYTQKSSGLINKSDVEDTIAQTQNLFSKNSKYTRICNISFEDITTLIGILTKLPDYSEFIESSNNKVKGINAGVFKIYYMLLNFVTQKKNEENWKKNKFVDSVHFYDIMKFFDMGIEVNEQDQNNNIEDLEFLNVKTFGELVDKVNDNGDLVDKVNNNIEESLKNIKDITFKVKKSKNKVLNLSFAKCRFINHDIDINELIEEKKMNENDDSDENSDEESI